MGPVAPNRSRFWVKHGRRLRIATSILAATVCLMASMGCLALNFGTWSTHTEDASVVSQTGSVTIAKGQEMTIYYPKSYGSPPNLELDDTWHSYKIIEQKADCFRVRNDSGTWALNWTARGVPVQPAVVLTPSVPATTEAANP